MNVILKYQFTCDVCQKSFTHKCNLKSHMIIHKRGPNLMYHCDLCRKSFTQKKRTNDTQTRSKFKVTYHCGLCQKSFI